MKKLLLILGTSVFALNVSAQNQSSQEPYMTQSLSGKNIKEVQAETAGGNISVAGVSDGEARIEVFVSPSNDRNKYTKQEIKTKLDEDYDFKISADNQKLTAIAKSKKNNMNWKDALSISFRIYVPQQVSTKLRTSGGNINLQHISGTQDFVTSGGNLNLTDLSGKTTGRTSGGNINLSKVSNDMDLSTSGGNIEASECSGKIELTTSGGNLRLNNLNGDIEATTSGGSIRGEFVKGELETHTSGGNIRLSDLACSVDASTSGGNIDVEISELGKYVKLSNSGGSISVDLPQDKGMDLDLRADRVSTGALKNFNGRMEEDRVSGSLNGGGIPVTIRGGSKVTLNLK